MIIGLIKIAPGNPGWFDSLSGTFLTIANPYAVIREGMNVTNIKKGIKAGTIVLVEGVTEIPQEEKYVSYEEIPKGEPAATMNVQEEEEVVVEKKITKKTASKKKAVKEEK